MFNQRRRWGFLIFTAFCGLTLTGVTKPSVFAQGIRAEEVVARVKAVAARLGSRGRRGPGPKPKGTYRPDKPLVKPQPSSAMEYSQVGVTVWRVEDGSKELGQEGEEALEQVEASTALSIGSRVRLGIEPLSRDGYLYVINREQFADGSYGTPRLIFPTLRTRKGMNAVKVSQLIYIPMPPSYFRINPSSSGKTQVAEVLTILLSPTPLELPGPIADKPLVLSAEQVTGWEKLWGIQPNRLELVGGAGKRTLAKAQTEGSKELEMGPDEGLTSDDALPQTVFRAAIKVGDPLLVTVPLRFAPK